MDAKYRVEKLIRDRIPEIIRSEGREPAVRQVGEDVVQPFIGLKLIEEAIEAVEAFGGQGSLVGELADVLEVMERMMAVHGLDWETVHAAKREKAEARGRFERNFLLEEPAEDRQRLYAAEQGTMLKALRENLALCRQAYLAVAFVMKSGVDLVYPALEAALKRGASIRLLTSDYLDVTDPAALARLAKLPGDFEMRAYHEPSRSYHPKAYIFEHRDGLGMAFIGSSNLSHSALRHGIEWNYQVQALDEGWPLVELIDKFEALYDSPHSLPIDQAFIEDYRARRRPPREILRVEDRPSAAILPRPAQVEALKALEGLREEGERKGMVVAATGIGKTFLAAFDSQPYGRVLFLAHRDELLTQARQAFLQVRPDAETGFYRGGEHDADADLLFASVGTLARAEHLQRFAPDHFDYIVVDEFHHAAAASYRAVLHYFAPQFLLGLTATPYRADNRDVFALCDGNVAYRVSFLEAIAYDWLCPFRYHGLYDDTNFEDVPWRNGRYDVEALSAAVETQARAAAVLAAYREHPSTAGIGFCVSIAHAAFMAAYFSEHGIPAASVHSGADSIDRGEAIAQLRRGDLKVLFTVDLFNEGVDIPEIDLVLFLRPTESSTIFLQQLGRGLRKHDRKDFLTVLDFIGNYKKAHYKAALITGQADDRPDGKEMKDLLHRLAEKTLELPAGVEIHLDLRVVDLMQKMTKDDPRRQQMEAAFDEIRDELGRRPTMLELHRMGTFDVRAYRQTWKSWFGFLKSRQALGEEEARLDGVAGDFLAELEKTQMTKSYKMVVLQSFLEEGGLGRPVPLEALTRGFRAFFSSSIRHRRDLEGTEVAAIADVSDKQLDAYLVRNPIAAWTNTGKDGTRKAYFAFDEVARTLTYTGPAASLEDAVRERVEYRLAEYFEVRFERKNVFNVINAGAGRGIIMLGSDEAAPIPRDQGWKRVVINGEPAWAKFAKIAVNVLKSEPEDGTHVPNRLTEELERMFGPGGYLPARGNRVRISEVPGEDDTWSIEPYRKAGH